MWNMVQGYVKMKPKFAANLITMISKYENVGNLKSYYEDPKVSGYVLMNNGKEIGSKL